MSADDDEQTEEIIDAVVDEMVDTAAKQLVKMGAVNPGTVREIIKKVFGSLAPHDVGERVLNRIKEIKGLTQS